MDVRHLLAELEPFGDYFTVVQPATPPPLPSLARLYAGDPALLAAIDATTRALRTTERRVGASILVQGLAARLWSPAVALLLLHDRLPVFEPATTWWAPDRHGGRLQVLGVGGEVSGDDTAADLRRVVVERHLAPLLTAVDRCVRLPDALLWGNVASAFLGSLDVLVHGRPELGTTGERLVTSLFDQPPFAGAGRFAGDRRGRFTRSSCCLYYQVPGGGLCGDCVLAARSRSSPA